MPVDRPSKSPLPAPAPPAAPPNPPNRRRKHSDTDSSQDSAQTRVAPEKGVTGPARGGPAGGGVGPGRASSQSASSPADDHRDGDVLLGQPARHKVAIGPEDRARLRVALARTGGLPRGKFAPSALTLEDGRVLYLSNKLAHGAFGKYRLGVMDGREWGVKELRTPDQQAHQADPGRRRATAVTPWAAAREEVDLLRQTFTDLRAHEVISHRGRLYLLMEPMQADVEAVKDRLKTSPLPAAQRLGVALTVLADAGDSLERMHAAQWVHRDIKPENLFVSGTGQIRLGDVGLASPLADRERLANAAGTPAFAAPELLHGGPNSRASDVWSLGMTVAELLTGSHPLELGAMAGLSVQRRLEKFTAWHQTLARTADGTIDVTRLRLGNRGGLEHYFARMHANFGTTATLAVLDFMLHPDPRSRSAAIDVAGWAGDRLRRLDVGDQPRDHLRALAAPATERQRQALALHAFARGDGKEPAS